MGGAGEEAAFASEVEGDAVGADDASAYVGEEGGRGEGGGFDGVAVERARAERLGLAPRRWWGGVGLAGLAGWFVVEVGDEVGEEGGEAFVGFDGLAGEAA